MTALLGAPTLKLVASFVRDLTRPRDPAPPRERVVTDPGALPNPATASKQAVVTSRSARAHGSVGNGAGREPAARSLLSEVPRLMGRARAVDVRG